MQPNYVGKFTQSEATAAQRTFQFFAPDVTDGFTAEPTLDYEDAASDVQVSKNGGAFANATGVVTEVSDGVYQYVAATAELDTLGTVVWKFVDAAARVVFAQAQVIALDLNVATVNPGAGGITAASFAAGAIDAAAIAVGAIAADAFAAGAIDAAAIAADAIGSSELAATAVAEIQSGLATGAQVLAERTQTLTSFPLGTLDADGSTDPVSLAHAISAVATLTGTWDGATVTIEECADVLADPQVWTTYASGAKTADGTVAITGPVAGIRATMTDDGATSDVAITLAIIS